MLADGWRQRRGGSVEEFKRFSVRMNGIAAVLFLINGVIASAGSQQYGSHFLAFGVVAFILLALNTFRLTRLSDDLKKVGEITVQGGWLWTSFSFVYITIAPAGVYKMSAGFMAVVVFIGIILLLSGIYVLQRTKKETGVALSV
jgi:hypothetical protein